jgi:tetratricopeptide (TPR) repeat protein
MNRSFMKATGYRRAVVMLATALVFVSACSEVRGRRLLQKANQLYRNGQYAEAVATFKEAEQYVPNMWLLWINKGYTCRGMLTPGAKTAENDAIVNCALEAFKRLQELKPDDQRGPALYVQTLFEADRFEELAHMYEARFHKNPKDAEALHGLIQVYSKWPNHLDQALDWHRKQVELKPDDAEAHYSAGVFIWQQLFTRGGGADMAAFDPRPDPNKPKQVKLSPALGRDDIAGQQRIDLADEGIKLLEHAVELRPKYHEAMAYVNLLYRQKSYAYFEQPKEWQKAVDKSTEWRNRTMAVMGKPGAPGAAVPAPSGGAEAAGNVEPLASGTSAPDTAADKKQKKKKVKKAKGHKNKGST